MKSGVLILSYFIFKLLCSETLCEPSVYSKNTINDAPFAAGDDSLQTNYHDVKHLETNAISEHDEKFEDVHESDKKQKDATSVSSTKSEIPPEEYFPDVPLQYLSLMSNKRGSYHDVGLLEANDDLENRMRIESLYAGLPFTLGQLVHSPNGITSQGIDISNDRNDLFNLFNDDSMTNLYPTRKQRSDEDILEQLEHDAMINNILPTMDAPFYRDAEDSVQQELASQSAENLMNYFPMEYGNRVPIVLVCSPKMTRGYPQTGERQLKVPLPYYNRGEDWAESKMSYEYEK